MKSGFFAQNRINKLFEMVSSSVFDLPVYTEELAQLIIEKMLANKTLSDRELDFVGVEEIVIEEASQAA